MSNLTVSERPESIWQRLRSGVEQLFAVPAMGSVLALLVACIFFAFQTDKFLTGRNLSLVIQQVVVVGTLAIGQTLVILTAGIDLSNGMIMAFSSVIMTSFAVKLGVPPLLAIAIGFAIATIFGLINGSLVALVKLPPSS